MTFYEYFLSEKEHLKFTMNCLNHDSNAIQTEAFHLLLIFLTAPFDKRGVKVNETLRKNSEALIAFIDKFVSEKHKDDERYMQKQEVATKALEEIQQQK